jgi:hypothetical protein
MKYTLYLAYFSIQQVGTLLMIVSGPKTGFLEETGSHQSRGLEDGSGNEYLNMTHCDGFHDQFDIV